MILSWFRLGMETTMLGLEAQTVIWTRMSKSRWGKDRLRKTFEW